jgi:hypothetical protein
MNNQIEEVKPGLYVRKVKTGWITVNPIKKDLSRPFSFKDNVNWKHLIIGSWSRLLTLIIILLIIFGTMVFYKHDMKVCGEKYIGDYYRLTENRCFNNCLGRCNLTIDNTIGPKSNVNLSKWMNQTQDQPQ